MTDITTPALALWGMSDATCTFVAGRENRVYRVTGDRGDFALRIRRPGLRTPQEMQSELSWMDAMDRAGLSVPRPEPTTRGTMLETVEGHQVDMVSWLRGHPMGNSGQALQLDDAAGVFFLLGRETARLHALSDDFSVPDGFHRVAWNLEGLVGEAPVWGRFWDNPTLDTDTRDLLLRFRARARQDLGGLSSSLDHGLIHADLVRENVLVDGDTLRLIDFDDGGYGFRLFDIATTLMKNRTEPDYERLKSRLLAGYRSIRPLDTTHLSLFMALRAATYVGWIIPRMTEDGSAARNQRFIAEARDLCSRYMASPVAR